MTEAKMSLQSEQQIRSAYKTGDVVGGKYEVLGELGKGGFGVVYLAFDLKGERLCALKTFKDELMADVASRAAFKREALLWVNLGEHPNIVSARLVTEVCGRLFVEMDYISPDVNGCVTLADHLKRARGPLGIEQVARWAVQFLAGMAYAREHGIECHRDINPRNILIADDGILKISDFGLAVAASAAIQSGIAIGAGQSREGIDDFSIWQSGGKRRCGTPGYMAPEVYRGDGAGLASDLYSFGLVLWQMARGSSEQPFSVPYSGDIQAYMEAVYQRQVSEEVPPVDEKLDRWIRVLLDLNPEQRVDLTLSELRIEFEWMFGENDPSNAKEDGVPKTSEFWNRKGESLYSLGQYAMALRCYNRALAMTPRKVTIWLNRGQVLEALGKRLDAFGCYDRALAIDPGCELAWYNRAFSEDKIGKSTLAVKNYRKFIELASEQYAKQIAYARNRLQKLEGH